jgi:Rrf2 family cysteine metabolism transcriptional repressor
MRISTRGRYGLRAMLELARGPREAPLPMSTLAERQGLSRKYLHALLTALKSAGLVHSLRGPGGGFLLARPPVQIKLSEILQAVEGPLSLVECVTDPRACNRSKQCPARRVWQDLSSAIENVLDDVTLGDMIASKAKTCSGPGAQRRQSRLSKTGRSAKGP